MGSTLTLHVRAKERRSSEAQVDTSWSDGTKVPLFSNGQVRAWAGREELAITTCARLLYPALAAADLFPIFGEDFVADPAPIAVVLTAIPVGYEAVREHLLDTEEQVHQAGTIFHLGRLLNGPWRVVVTQTGQGNPRAAALAERAISHYRPDLVMLVGVAGRLPDRQIKQGRRRSDSLARTSPGVSRAAVAVALLITAGQRAWAVTPKRQTSAWPHHSVSRLMS